MSVRIDRQLKFSVESGSITNQEPEMWIVWHCLRGSLGILQRMSIISVLQGQLCGARQARIFNVRTPAKLGRSLRLARRSLGRLRCVGPDLVNLRAD